VEAHLWRKNRLDGANRVTPTHLAFITALLPTPTGDDANNVTRKSGDHQSLAREVHNLLPTPTTQDGANNAGPSQWKRNSHPLNVVAAVLHGAPTNPRSDDGKTSPDCQHPSQLTIEVV
jgi:hypothetical protein